MTYVMSMRKCLALADMKSMAANATSALRVVAIREHREAAAQAAEQSEEFWALRDGEERISFDPFVSRVRTAVSIFCVADSSAVDVS